MNNSEILLQQLEKLKNKKGFIICSIGDYYIQFNKQEAESEILFEAVSHNFLDILS